LLQHRLVLLKTSTERHTQHTDVPSSKAIRMLILQIYVQHLSTSYLFCDTRHVWSTPASNPHCHKQTVTDILTSIHQVNIHQIAFFLTCKKALMSRNTEIHLHCVRTYYCGFAKYNYLSALKPPDNVYTSALNISPAIEAFSKMFRHV
jgi:hypothetical protein